MIWFASLDPSNFSLNLNTTHIHDNPIDKHYGVSSIHNCLFGELEQFKQNLNKVSGKEKRIEYAYLASTIWHEQRHFVDLVLLNHGNYIFREFLTCYLNTPIILRDILSCNIENLVKL